MKKITFKGIFVPTISLFVICLVVALLLGFTNELTKDAIAENQQKKADEAKQAVCSQAITFEGEKGLEIEVYRGFDKDGNLVGYAIPAKSKGYGGDVEIMVGFDTEGSITGVSIVSINETPGLGMNAQKDSFRSQFEGEIPDGGFSAKKGGEGIKQIDALTSATITSEAVSQAVNNAINVYNSLEGGGN
ncbi:MAG: RnfABCDGE type electron transport complex subunit G [Ruminococcaceae bacterium]|nr:RnfABCDGE type electron transport complex subunit G [Oscillospiraceae bacterium]